jgi:hypothetical protein
MQLKVKRDQREKGLMFKKTIYTLSARVEYSDEEREVINSRKLGGRTMYASADAKLNMTPKLNVTPKSLKDGVYVESEDLAAIAEIEEGIRQGCKNLKSHIQGDGMFKGQEDVEEI